MFTLTNEALVNVLSRHELLRISSASVLTASLVLGFTLGLAACGSKNGNRIKVSQNNNRQIPVNPGSEANIITEQVMHAQTLVATVAANELVGAKSPTLPLPSCAKRDEDENLIWETGNKNCGAWEAMGPVSAKVTFTRPNPLDGVIATAMDIKLTTKIGPRRTLRYTLSKITYNQQARLIKGALDVDISTTAPGNQGHTHFQTESFVLQLDAANNVTGMKMGTEADATRTSVNGKISTHLFFTSPTDATHGLNNGFVKLEGSPTSAQITSGRWGRQDAAGAASPVLDIDLTNDGYKVSNQKIAVGWKCKMLGYCINENGIR